MWMWFAMWKVFKGERDLQLMPVVGFSRRKILLSRLRQLPLAKIKLKEDAYSFSVYLYY